MKLSLLKSISAVLASLSLTQASPLFKRANSTSSEASSSVVSTADPATSTDAYVSVSYGKYGAIYKPKVFLINMFYKEQEPWIAGLDLTYNVTIPGLSPVYPEIHCVSNYTICQITTGEGEINAATTITALTLSPIFDLTETYFLISGIAGGSPEKVTLGSATFPKYAVQVGLEYEADARQIPSNWTSGYVGFGDDLPNEYPTTIYGSEIFELNEALRNKAIKLLSNVKLSNGSSGNVEFRELYKNAPANLSPKVVACDTATSDVYWFGSELAEAFQNYTSILSNGTATYCSTQQEDNASLEALMRMSKHGLVDFSRIVILRTISDFDRPPQSLQNETIDFFFDVYQGGSKVAFDNLYIAGLPFVEDVIEHWDHQYGPGIYKAKNYIGDYFGTLGGKPNFGLPSTK